jgi:anti-sigma factor RsiW
MMCPDRQILSVYLDGELSSPWKEKMENHLAHCGECREKLETYRAVSRMLEGAGAGSNGAGGAGVKALEEGAKDRVWLKVQNLGELPLSPGFWQRSLSVPLPVVAAAAVILFIALGAVLFRQNQPFPAQDAVAGMDLGGHGVIPVSDMSGVLQYLGSQDAGDIVILRLPESKNFMSSGEPAILKAADLPARSSRPR